MSCAWTDEVFGSSQKTQYGANYYSYRGEDCPPRLDADLCEYLLPDGAEEYHYLFRNGEWVCYNMNCYEQKLPEVVEIPTGALMV